VADKSADLPVTGKSVIWLSSPACKNISVPVLPNGLVARVRDWPHSSFHWDVRAGIFPEDWAGDAGRIGEFVSAVSAIEGFRAA